MKSQDPPSEQLQVIVNLLTQKRLKQALFESSQILEKFPNSFTLFNIVGASNAGLKQYDAALENYKKALEIKPDYAEARENLILLLTSYIPQKDNSHLIVELNEKIRKIDIKENISKIITDDQVVSLFAKSQDYINSFDLDIKIKKSQAFRRNSVNLNCERHLLIFDKHDVIPEFCFSCYKVQVEPRSIIELIKLFIIFDQLDLQENNTRKCMVELRPEISGFYKGLIYCSSLKQANQISEYLDITIKQSIGLGLCSTVKRGCSEYAISYPDYKEINNTGPQVMNYKKEWEVIEESHDKNEPFFHNDKLRVSLPGLNLSDILIIRKWIDYAKGIGDPSADLLNQDTVYYQDIYDRAKARIDPLHLTTL